MPGLVVVAPATPQDNYALLRGGRLSGDPVVYLEHKELWARQAEVDERRRAARAGRDSCRPGGDLTLVSWSKAVHVVARRRRKGWLREARGRGDRPAHLWPWDREAVLASARAPDALAGRARGGAGRGLRRRDRGDFAEESAAKVARLGGLRVPVGYSPGLEAEVRITPEKIVAKAQALLLR